MHGIRGSACTTSFFSTEKPMKINEKYMVLGVIRGNGGSACY